MKGKERTPYDLSPANVECMHKSMTCDKQRKTYKVQDFNIFRSQFYNEGRNTSIVPLEKRVVKTYHQHR